MRLVAVGPLAFAMDRVDPVRQSADLLSTVRLVMASNSNSALSPIARGISVEASALMGTEDIGYFEPMSRHAVLSKRFGRSKITSV